MLTLAEINIGPFVIALGGMFFTLLLVGGILVFSWHEEPRKRAYKLQKEREQTHREIAAYVAEGSIAPADAERMIAAMARSEGEVGTVRAEATLAAGQAVGPGVAPAGA